ncbi:hypothetical protein FBY30_2735 [Arthrobacter sp. SLBN-83]|uniref:hypothetical protein n=1 Tax=Arthrobacter sp. SLBN-83 TaxID=2768449 RepID=UPI001154E0A2|nr:hypothetical protein [Arthrobacter sp. SLBN-83]TQJ60467.1 hypothetical protein FBY30_2735 [Arthrobacter sp. SLBN-83]
MTLGETLTEPSWRVHVLDGCKAKILRARELIEEVSHSINVWLTGHGPMVFDVADAGDSRWLILMPEMDRPPTRLGILVSDALHNLRSSLDHLIVSLVLANGEHPGQIQFPYCETEDSWNWRIRNKELGRIAPWGLDILRQHQPFSGASSLLLLREASNADKHNYYFPLSIGFRHGTSLKIDVADGHCSVLRLFEYMTPIFPGQPIYEVKTKGAEPQVESSAIALKCGFGLVHDGGLGLDLWLLRQMADDAESILNSFRSSPASG